jgi:SAM-dependent methyltransferase
MPSALRKDVPWIDDAADGPEYLDPVYYDRILKPYVFSGVDDLALFRRYLSRSHLPQKASILEIGPGTGRASRLLSHDRRRFEIDLVDQSQRMLKYLESTLALEGTARYLRSDAVTYLAKTSHTYDCVLSLWSLSHSIHQNIADKGEVRGQGLAAYALRRLFGSVLKRSGKFFIIHFDSTSDEQTVSLRQRCRIEPWLKVGSPSPSQVIVERVLAESAAEGIIRFNKQHMVGSPIIYSDLDEAMEVFMNFHMEGVFNRTREFSRVLDALATDLARYRMPDGTVALEPACFIYEGTRL